MKDSADKPWFLRILPDVLAYGIGLGIAYFFRWETADLVWSLWLSSLVLGYVTLLSAIGGGAWFGLFIIKHEEFKKKHRLPAILIGIVIGLFVLGFFSLHFCGFHAGHSVFLNVFFPVEGMPSDGFGEAFMNPVLLWILTFRHLIEPYGLFLIPALIAERQHVFKPLIQAVKKVGAARDSGVLPTKETKGKERKKFDPMKGFMSRPYVNVMRMHLLIFFFAICHFLSASSFFVYAVVYSVYFFPWEEMKKLKAATKAAPATAGTPEIE